MCTKYLYLLLQPLVIFHVLIVNYEVNSQDLFVTNLDSQCLRCLCYAATNCALGLGCIQGYCGPYKVSKIYWVDAGRPTLPEDDPERAGAYEDCALSYECAQKIVTGYLAKFAKDCNGDGVTNCDDFAMINFNGGYQCHPPLDRNEAGRNWTSRYKICAPI